MDEDGDGLPENLEFLRQQTDSPGVFIETQFTYDPDHGQLATVTPPTVSPADHMKIRRHYYTAAENGSGIFREGLLKEIQVISDDGTPPVTIDNHLRQQFDYDSAGNLSTITDARGHVTEFGWDGRGRLIRQTERLGATSSTWQSTLLRYGAPNNPDFPLQPPDRKTTPRRQATCSRWRSVRSVPRARRPKGTSTVPDRSARPHRGGIAQRPGGVPGLPPMSTTATATSSRRESRMRARRAACGIGPSRTTG